jgi:hypothetical protein
MAGHTGIDDPGALRLQRLTCVEPLLPALPLIIYEYTIPDLTVRTRAAMRRRLNGGSVYRGYRAGLSLGASEEHYVRVLESAQLISGVYSHFLDPLRFGQNGRKIDKAAIFTSFARTLIGPRFLPSVELVAANLFALRALDDYQAGVGTNAARWMQYLAYETARTNLVRYGFTAGQELDRLRSALTALRDSATTLERFRALARDANGHSPPVN